MMFRRKRQLGILVLLFVLVMMSGAAFGQEGSETPAATDAKSDSAAKSTAKDGADGGAAITKPADTKGTSGSQENKKADGDKKPEGDEKKAAQPSPSSGLFQMLIVIVPMFAFLYFVFIRPEKKKEQARKAMLGALKKNDEVLTYGGMIGTVSKLTDREVTLCVDKKNDVQIKFSRSAVAEIIKTKEDNGKNNNDDSRESDK